MIRLMNCIKLKTRLNILMNCLMIFSNYLKKLRM